MTANFPFSEFYLGKLYSTTTGAPPMAKYLVSGWYKTK